MDLDDQEQLQNDNREIDVGLGWREEKIEEEEEEEGDRGGIMSPVCYKVQEYTLSLANNRELQSGHGCHSHCAERKVWNI